MCGIAGLVSLDGTESGEALGPVAQAMADRIAHRGPDAEGLWLGSRIALSHRRLSIIDLQTGDQPMQTPDGDLVVTFNGEIFNYIELREQLQARGHVFTTTSDTEVILHLYREFGREFPALLNGQFAIGLWDKRQQCLILVRDRVGICPLFYASTRNRFAFASEIKALQPALPQKLSLSARGLDQVFTGWCCVGQDTPFEGVSQLEPGMMLVLDSDGRQTLSRYWNLEFPLRPEDFDTRPEEVLVEELHELLVDAIRLRLRADVPVGAYLSGGLDSSVLVALIKSSPDVRLQSFSLEFDNRALDETTFQKQVVDHLGLDHAGTRVSVPEITADLEKTVWHTESPILRTAPSPMGKLSKLVHDSDYKVVLTGEGADEILGGYDIFKEEKVRQFWARQPDSRLRPRLLLRLYPYLNLPDNKDAQYLKRFFGIGLDSPELLWHAQQPRWQTTARARMFYSEEFRTRLADDYTDHIAALFPPEAGQWHWFNRAQYLEMKTLMAGYLLSSQGDRMLARNAVEGRFPYLDHRLIAFANRLHPRVKMKVLNEKYLLKKMATAYLPASISTRFKQPYRAPDVALGGDRILNQGLLDYLTPGNISQAGVFEPKKVAMLLKKAARPATLNIADSQTLTGILTTQILYHSFCK